MDEKKERRQDGNVEEPRHPGDMIDLGEHPMDEEEHQRQRDENDAPELEHVSEDQQMLLDSEEAGS